jgi:glutamate racemase
VPLVEEGWTKEKIALEIALKYLRPLKEARVDTLILGCTHYPLLKSIIKKAMGSNVRLIDSAKQTAREVKQVLLEESLNKLKGGGPAHYHFWVSDEPNKFKGLAKRFLGYPLKNVRKVRDV